MYIRQRWKEPRLALTNLSSLTNGTNSVLVTSNRDKLWLPDLFIKNDKISSISDVTVTNQFIRLYEPGELVVSQRVTTTVSCSMHLSRYPFDVQNCSMLLESCEYQ